MGRFGSADNHNYSNLTYAEAKAIELRGWSYPRHLAGRYFSVVAHGDVTGAETLRRTLSDWLTDMSLISAGGLAENDPRAGARVVWSGPPVEGRPASAGPGKPKAGRTPGVK